MSVTTSNLKVVTSYIYIVHKSMSRHTIDSVEKTYQWYLFDGKIKL